MRKLLTFLLLFCMISFAAVSAKAGDYVAGTENADVAALSQGFTVNLYNSFYSASALKDNNGTSIGDFNQFKYTTMARAYYMTPFCFLGANYGFGIGLPVGYESAKFNGVSADTYGIGDLLIEPVILKWSQPSFDTFITLGLFTPTGSFDVKDSLNMGQGYWTGIGTIGGQYYIDSQKSWAAYAVARYEMSSEQNDTKLSPGDVFTGEYGLTKSFMFGKDALKVGAAGYTQFQTTDNKVDGAVLPDSKQFTTGIGPVVGYKIDSLGLDIGAKVFFEVASKNQPEGVRGIVSVSKAF